MFSCPFGLQQKITDRNGMLCKTRPFFTSKSAPFKSRGRHSSIAMGMGVGVAVVAVGVAVSSGGGAEVVEEREVEEADNGGG